MQMLHNISKLQKHLRQMIRLEARNYYYKHLASAQKKIDNCHSTLDNCLN